MLTRALYLLLAGLVILPVPALGQDDAGDEEPGVRARRHWNLFLRPRYDHPEKQLAYAQRLEEEGKKKARRQYRALVAKWPEAREAPLAQLAYARLLDEAGKRKKAFEEYQYLMQRYIGRFPGYEEVLQRQFDIAVELMETRRATFFIFPGFYAPERSIPYFEQVISNGPHWERAAEAQFLIGRANEKINRYEEAILAYDAVQNRYPESEFASTAAYRAAYCLYLIAEENPNSMVHQENAYAAMSLFVQHYPEAEERVLAVEYRRALLERLARAAFKKAAFYDKYTDRPEAALVAYRRFVEQYPNSEWTRKAEQRIDALTSQEAENP